MSSLQLFEVGRHDQGTTRFVSDDMHRQLGPLIAEFVTTGSLARAEWTLERIARGLAATNFPFDPMTARQCTQALAEIVKVRKATLKNHPFGMASKAAEWLTSGPHDGWSDVSRWIDEQAEHLAQAPAGPVGATPFVWSDPVALPLRPWLYGTHLIRGEISATLSPGGIGKTSLAIVEALAMATGFPLLGVQPDEALRVWIWNGEEPVDELRRRVAAAIKHFGILPDQIGDRLLIDSGLNMPLVIAEDGQDGTQVNAPLVHELIGELGRRQVDVMLIDPFVSTHNVSENDNNAIQKAATAWKEVATGAGVAVGLAHHTRKLGGKDATTEDSRGADALISKVRDGRVLNTMSEADAARLGVLGLDRFRYFWTGPGGKSNMSARTGAKTWFRMESVGLGNGYNGGPGDSVGVVTQWRPPQLADEIEPEQLVKLGEVMGAREWRAAPQASKLPDWIGAAVAEAFGIERVAGWERKAKVFVSVLEAGGVIAKREVPGPNRKAMPVFTFSGGREGGGGLLD